MTCNCNPNQPAAQLPCSCSGPQTYGTTTNIHTPEPCQATASNHPMHELRLYSLRCGTWVYAGQMSVNSPPQVNTRSMWDSKAYTITQATLTGTEPGKDKWEVMLVTAGAGYTADDCRQPCTPTPYHPPVLPPSDPAPGIYVDNQTCQPVTYPVTNYLYTPLPVEQSLGCGPQYSCRGYPR